MASLAGGIEPAHEIVQEAFARALRDRRRFRGDGNLEAWVWRIAVNCALQAAGERLVVHVKGFSGLMVPTGSGSGSG